MTKVYSKSARLQFIAETLAREVIPTQDALRAVLQAAGYRVTQATLSRDLDELGAVKVPAGDGLAYALPNQAEVEPAGSAAGSRLGKVAGEVMTSVAAAGNLVVVHTVPGAAHFLAGALDRGGWPQVLGSVAGDDTVMIVARDAAAAAEVEAGLAKLVSARTPVGRRLS